MAIEACEELVERIKKELPVWGKELLESNGESWKVNT
jgi:molybdopterin synthase catalytic subunit